MRHVPDLDANPTHLAAVTSRSSGQGTEAAKQGKARQDKTQFDRRGTRGDGADPDVVLNTVAAQGVGSQDSQARKQHTRVVT